MSLPTLPEAAFPFLHKRIVFCGFSGGSDSLYLLLALKAISEPLHFQLRAIHFEHGLRGEESRADAEWCREKCLRERIPFLRMDLAVRKNSFPGEGEEAAARRLRLAHWKKLTETEHDSIIVLGHHAGDRKENLFLRLFRGSNATGLSSMRFHSTLSGMEILRPLISRTKAEIESVLLANGEVWREDSTNHSAEYKRNFLRLEILPVLEKMFPFASKGILHSLDALECDADFLETTACSTYGKMKKANHFSPEKWNSLHPAVLCRVLRLFLTDELNISVIPDRQLLIRFQKAVESPPEKGESLFLELKNNPEFSLCVEREAVFVIRKHGIVSSAVWNWKEQESIQFGKFELKMEEGCGDETCGPFCACFSENLPCPLILDVRHDGDRMVPFGKHTPVLLKKLYSDAKIRVYERDGIPVLRDIEGNILWIPGVKRSVCFPRTEKKYRIITAIKKSDLHFSKNAVFFRKP